MQAARNKLFGNMVPKDPLAFLYEFVSRIGINKFHRQKHLSPKKTKVNLLPPIKNESQIGHQNDSSIIMTQL